MVEQAGSTYAAMKPKAKLLWLAALLSGAYQQSSGGLQNNEGQFCCLGVLCDISEGGKWSNRLDGRWAAFNSKSGFPPDSVYRQTGLDADAAIVLADMNDESGKTFEEIAAWIDANL